MTITPEVEVEVVVVVVDGAIQTQVQATKEEGVGAPVLTPVDKILDGVMIAVAAEVVDGNLDLLLWF